MVVPVEITNKALSYLGALTVNGIEICDEDVINIFEVVYPVLAASVDEKLIPIRLALTAAVALDNYSGKLDYLKEEYQRQKAEFFKPKFERKI